MFAWWIRILLCGLFMAAPAYGQTSRVALLLEHGEPSAWTELLRKGLAKAGSDFGLEANVIIAPPGPGQKEIFLDAARSNDVVLVASDALHELLRDNAANFRRVKFGSIDAGIRAPNIMSVTFADEQAAFLAGAAAAMLAGTSPVVGWLSGKDTPAMRSLFNGFSEGAALAAADARIVQAVAGSFTDPSAAAAKTEWLLKNGARVIVLAAGAGNAAARQIAAKAGVPVILLDNSEDSAVISKRADQAVQEIISSAAGDFRGKEIITYDLKNGGVAFTGLEHLSSGPGTANIARRIAELKREIADGNIRIRSLRQRTLCDCLD